MGSGHWQWPYGDMWSSLFVIGFKERSVHGESQKERKKDKKNKQKTKSKIKQISIKKEFLSQK